MEEKKKTDIGSLGSVDFWQWVLDEQFLQLQQLQDESSPNFVSEVVNIYFHESEKLLRNLRGLLYVSSLAIYHHICYCFFFPLVSISIEFPII